MRVRNRLHSKMIIPFENTHDGLPAEESRWLHLPANATYCRVSSDGVWAVAAGIGRGRCLGQAVSLRDGDRGRGYGVIAQRPLNHSLLSTVFSVLSGTRSQLVSAGLRSFSYAISSFCPKSAEQPTLLQ